MQLPKLQLSSLRLSPLPLVCPHAFSSTTPPRSSSCTLITHARPDDAAGDGPGGPLNRRILQVPGLASLLSNQQTTPSASPRRHKSRSPSSSFPPGAYQTVTQTEEWEEVGTEDIAPHPTKHPVLQLVLKRAKEGSLPGKRTDNAKLGLVVEGGGMRGVVSGAMLMGLHTLGYKNTFDAVYGASAGAINATFFLAGQPHGLTIYSEDLTGKRFIDERMLLSSASDAKFMNLNYLVDDVMNNVKPLDWQAVIDSNVPLKVVASALKPRCEPLLLENFESPYDLAQCLKASAAVPKISGPPIEHRGYKMVDAAVFQPVPVQAALEDGCTHVLVLSTRPAMQHTTWQRYVRGTVVWAVKKTVLNAPYMTEAWASNLAKEDQVMQEEADLLSTLQRHPEDVRDQMGAYIIPVYPQSTGGCSPLTVDPPILHAAEAEGWRAIMMLFDRGELVPPREASAVQQQQHRTQEAQSSAAAASVTQQEGTDAQPSSSSGITSQAEQLVRRWLYTGLESSKEAVARAFSSPSSTARSGSEGESSARVSSAAAQGSDASTSTSSYDPSSPVSDVGVSGRNAEGSQHQQGSVPHSTMGMLQGDGGDSVLAAAADYVEHYAGNHSREEGSSSTGDLNGSSSSSSSVDNSSTDGGQKQEGAPRSNEQ